MLNYIRKWFLRQIYTQANCFRNKFSQCIYINIPLSRHTHASTSYITHIGTAWSEKSIESVDVNAHCTIGRYGSWKTDLFYCQFSWICAKMHLLSLEKWLVRIASFIYTLHYYYYYDCLCAHLSVFVQIETNVFEMNERVMRRWVYCS